MRTKDLWAKRTKWAMTEIRAALDGARRWRKTQLGVLPAEMPTPARFTPEAARPHDSSDESLEVWGFKDTRFFINNHGNIELSGQRYALAGHELPKLLPWIEDILGLPIEGGDTRPSRYGTSIPEARINKAFFADLKSSIAADRLVVDPLVRQRHGHGQTQEEMYSVNYGSLPRVPDLVVYPTSEEEVQFVVQTAVRHNVCLIPYGGGTNVTDALRCPVDEERMIVSVDMQKMNKVLWIDPVNRMACIEAGAVGRNIVRMLENHGFMMGHEPDSIEFSTLGGWIATNASGMKKNKYGNIEDIVLDLNVVSPLGMVQRYAMGPREATGIDPRRWMFGSEGNLGIITNAIVKIFPIPEKKVYGSIIFPNFEKGIAFMYELSNESSWPASVRLVDNRQFQLSMALKPADPDESVWQKRKSKFQKLIVTEVKGFDPDEMVACTLVFEGTEEEVRNQEHTVYAIAKRHGGLRGGGENGERGYQLTFGIAYIRDFMMKHHLMAESFETSMPWTNVHALCENVKRRIGEEHAKRGLPGQPFVTARVTQLYRTGAVVYFYFAFYAKGIENPQLIFNEIEHAAREEILKSGGSLSHHHGIGKLRRDFMPQILSPGGLMWKEKLKTALDPLNIFGAMNQFPAGSLGLKAPDASEIPPAPAEAAAASEVKPGGLRGFFVRVFAFFARLFGMKPAAQKSAIPPSSARNGSGKTEPAMHAHTTMNPGTRHLPAAATHVPHEADPRPLSERLHPDTGASTAKFFAPKASSGGSVRGKRGYFSGKSFIITGASSGIGRSLVVELTRRGANVIAMARNGERLKTLQEATGQWILVGDVMHQADCDLAVDLAVEHFGGIHGIIHNAGVSMRGLAEETRLSVVDTMLGVNFYPLVYLYQRGFHHLRATRGHLVGISSMMGHFSTEMRSAYCASKHALQGYLDSVRLENAKHNVHVMSVAPGFVRTEITVNALNAHGHQHAQESENTAGGMEPEEVAKRILRAMEQRKRDCFPSGMREMIGLGLSRVAPGVLDRIMMKTTVT